MICIAVPSVFRKEFGGPIHRIHPVTEMSLQAKITERRRTEEEKRELAAPPDARALEQTIEREPVGREGGQRSAFARRHGF